MNLLKTQGFKKLTTFLWALEKMKLKPKVHRFSTKAGGSLQTGAVFCSDFYGFSSQNPFLNAELVCGLRVGQNEERDK